MNANGATARYCCRHAGDAPTLAKARVEPFESFAQRWSALAWDALLEIRGAPSPFLTLDWLETWIAHFAPEEARVWTVGPAGNPEAICFTNLEIRRYGPLALRTLRACRNSHSQRAALLVAMATEDSARALFRGLVETRHEWNILRLDGVPTAQGLADRLVDAAATLGCVAQIDRRFAHVRVPIETDFATFYRAVKRKKRRDQERMMRRLADEHGQLTLRALRGVEAGSVGFEAFLGIERCSWKAFGGEAIGPDALLRSFYGEIARRFAARDLLEVDLLVAGGRPIAAGLSLRFGKHLLALKTVYDKRFDRFSPGWILYRHVLEQAFGRGLAAVDFYSDLPFARSWSKIVEPYADLVIFSPTPGGRLLALAKRARDRYHRVRHGAER